MFVNYYFRIFLISVCFSFSFGNIYVMNKHPGLDGNASAPAMNIAEQSRLPCKEELVAQSSDTPWYSMDDVSLHHYGTQRRDSTGNLTYFDRHFAVQTDGHVGIWLTEKKDYSSIRYQLYVGADSNNRTHLWYNGKRVQDIATPGILSSNQFRSFYIKIDDGTNEGVNNGTALGVALETVPKYQELNTNSFHGKLQFGKEGDAPLISFPGVNLGRLNYYFFFSYRLAKLRYCPAVVEGSS